MNWWQEYNDQQCERQDGDAREEAVELVHQLEADGYLAVALSAGGTWRVEVVGRRPSPLPPAGDGTRHE